MGGVPGKINEVYGDNYVSQWDMDIIVPEDEDYSTTKRNIESALTDIGCEVMGCESSDTGWDYDEYHNDNTGNGKYITQWSADIVIPEDADERKFSQDIEAALTNAGYEVEGCDSSDTGWDYDEYTSNCLGESYKPKKKLTEAVGDKKYGGTVIGDEETTVGAPKKGLTEAGHYDPVTHEWVTGEDKPGTTQPTDEPQQAPEPETPKEPLHKAEYDRAMSMMQFVNDPEKNLESLFDILVPQQGKADTVAGEAVRAMMRLLYRDYNDGDKFFEGYGLETCASPAMWLMNSFDETGKILRKMLDDAYKLAEDDDAYTNGLQSAATALMEELRDMGDDALAPNEGDCLHEDISEIEDAQPTYDYDVDVSGEMLDTLMEHDIVDWNWVRDTLDDILSNDFRSGELNQWARDAFTVEGLNREDYNNMDQLEKWFWECVEDTYNENIDEIEGEDEDEEDDEDYEDEEEE